jgi:hypothetical protein
MRWLINYYNCSRREEPEPTPTLEDEAALMGGLTRRSGQECILTCLIIQGGQMKSGQIIFFRENEYKTFIFQ